MNAYFLTRKSGPFHLSVPLASSKSESNRALILQALTGFEATLSNISIARDTQTMVRLLQSQDPTADVLDAGTTMRFLTAYFAATNQTKRMTGTSRMCERPIGILVEALQTLGAHIEYEGQIGYPPLRIQGFSRQQTSTISVRGDVSSQYISALLMIAPTLPDGLTIHLTGSIGSIPYITMTLAQMAAFGVQSEVNWEEKWIKIPHQNYQPIAYSIESDWSGASYWYSLLALDHHPESTITLLGLKENSLQGDSAIVEIMRQLGVQTTFLPEGVTLTKIQPKDTLQWDFTNCPDLAQTVAVVLAGLRIPGTFFGLESLKIKETDRVLALQNELVKIGAKLTEVVPETEYALTLETVPSESPQIHTYDDHRMALAFAPLAMLFPVVIEDPGVVVKSYPNFWDHLSEVVEIQEQ